MFLHFMRSLQKQQDTVKHSQMSGRTTVDGPTYSRLAKGYTRVTKIFACVCLSHGSAYLSIGRIFANTSTGVQFVVHPLL